MAEEADVGVTVFIRQVHMCVVSCLLELLRSFLRARLSAVAVSIFSYPLLRCSFIRCSSVFSCKALSGRSVDVDRLHVSDAVIHVTHVREAGGRPGAQSPDDHRICLFCILHTVDMTQPSQCDLSYLTYWEGYGTR